MFPASFPNVFFLFLPFFPPFPSPLLPPSKRKRLKIHRKNRLKTKRRLHVVCSPTDGRGRLIFALAYPWKKSDAGQRWIIINRALAQSKTNRTMAQPNRILIEKWASPMGYRSNAGQRQTNSKRILTWAIATIFFQKSAEAFRPQACRALK